MPSLDPSAHLQLRQRKQLVDGWPGVGILLQHAVHYDLQLRRVLGGDGGRQGQAQHLQKWRGQCGMFKAQQCGTCAPLVKMCQSSPGMQGFARTRQQWQKRQQRG